MNLFEYAHLVIMSRMYKRAFVYLIAIILITITIDISGVFRHPWERDYHTEFEYPLNIPDFPSLVQRFRNHEPVAFDPINTMYSNLTFLNTAPGGCPGPFQLMILVKSAPMNVEKRSAIRSTWGYSRRFSDVAIKTVFLLGEVTFKRSNRKEALGHAIELEIEKFNDIVRANFIDSYYNNTIKSMMAMRWLTEYCSDFKFALFVDDDMYVSVKNLLKFVRHPAKYPEYWENQKDSDHEKLLMEHDKKLAALKASGNSISSSSLKSKTDNTNKEETNSTEKILLPPPRPWKNSAIDFDIELGEDARLYAGYVFFVPPHRHKIGTKWFLPLDEYPFNYFPPYVPAGAIVMSKAAVMDIYYASFFTRHFRFDDIFVAICAKKMNIEPFRSDYFRFWPTSFKNPYDNEYKYVITAHGFDDPDELRRFWNVQKSLGNA